MGAGAGGFLLFYAKDQDAVLTIAWWLEGRAARCGFRIDDDGGDRPCPRQRCGPVQCVILAGGMGTRMQHDHPDVPKTLIDVAGAPFADWQLAGLANQGITDIVYCIGHLGDMVRSYVGDGGRWGASVAYVEERDGLLGTGGALRLAVDEGVIEEAFFYVDGETSTSRWISQRVDRAFVDYDLPALMTVIRNDGHWDASNAVLENGRVVRYEKELAGSLYRRCVGSRSSPSLVFRREVIVEMVQPSTWQSTSPGSRRHSAVRGYWPACR